MKQENHFARFSSTEAALVVGLSIDTLRSWRAQGFLPESTGQRAGFTAEELCGLALLALLNRAGTPLSHAAPACERLAPALLRLALDEPGAIRVAGDPLGCANFGLALHKLKQGGAGAGALLCPTIRSPWFLGLEATGRALTADHPGELFEGSRLCVVVVDLQSLARRIVTDANRPLCEIHFTPSPSVESSGRRESANQRRETAGAASNDGGAGG